MHVFSEPAGPNQGFFVIPGKKALKYPKPPLNVIARFFNYFFSSDIYFSTIILIKRHVFDPD